VISISFEDEPEKSFAICSLNLNSRDSQSLSVVLDEQSSVKFTLTGKNSVHLSGYYQPDNGGGEEGGFYGGDDEVESDFDEEEDVDEVDNETLQKANAAIAAQLDKKRKAAQNGGAEQNKKPKQEVAAAQPKQVQKPKADTPSKPQEAKKAQQPQKSPQQPKVKEFPNGLKIITTQEGTGAEATKGKKVGVKYVGKLTKNGKVFDASKKPFTFTLGAREVITGWDLGVAGMKVGERRQLIIPAELGYGKEGAGREIPPNSSLTFDVELIHVK